VFILAVCSGPARLVSELLRLYLLFLVGWIVLSWFPTSPGSAVESVRRFLAIFIDPVLTPLRRVIPPLGMFDISPIVVFIAIAIIQGALGCGGGGLF
jgi:YggT family protein